MINTKININNNINNNIIVYLNLIINKFAINNFLIIVYSYNNKIIDFFLEYLLMIINIFISRISIKTTSNITIKKS